VILGRPQMDNCRRPGIPVSGSYRLCVKSYDCTKEMPSGASW
jgi:hypothetical protein